MASLVIDGNPPRVFQLVKRVTSIGRGQDNDVKLEARGVQPRHGHLVQEASGHRLVAADGSRVVVNGRARAEQQLIDGDVLTFGGVDLLYMLKAPPRRSISEVTAGSTEQVPLEAFERLYTFSARLSSSPNLEALEKNLVDAVIDLAGADRGYLLVGDDHGRIDVVVARRSGGEDLASEEARLSESIARDVYRRSEPVLLTDALDHSMFGESHSVVNYQLRSVAAVPIRFRDQTLGVLYLGSDMRSDAFTPIDLQVLGVFAAQAGLLIKSALLVESLERDKAELTKELDSRTFGEIVGGSRAMQDVFRTVSKVAPTDLTVVITGETGTGKELIAREVHRRSTRAQGPFIPINTSAIPENLLEAELFGHVKGAFTGAVTDRRGKLEEADGGTVLLDEIGDLPLSLQAKLLRVLQERQVERLGSNNSRPLDIRIIAATHRDLASMREEGTFREDLFFRLDEVQVHLPPLRERDEDILLLANYFLSRWSDRLGRDVRRFTAQTQAALARARWPGNVRELEAKVKKAVVMASGQDVTLEDLGMEAGQLEAIAGLKEAKEEFARRYVRQVLAFNDGNRSQTARDLGVDPRTIYKYLEGK